MLSDRFIAFFSAIRVILSKTFSLIFCSLSFEVVLFDFGVEVKLFFGVLSI